MIGGTLYLCGVEAETGELCGDTEPCSMCKRLIINAGIETVVIRSANGSYRVVSVQDWVENDTSLFGGDTY